MRKLISTPTNLAITLAEAKKYLRVEDDYDDEIIVTLIKSATLKAEGILGTQLTDGTYIEALSGFKTQIDLKSPTKSITSVKYYDSENVLQTIPNTDYSLQVYGLDCKLVFKNDFQIPTIYYRDDALLIEYVSGYVSIPEDIKNWILIQIATSYEYREAFSNSYGNNLTEINPKYTMQFLSNHRKY